MRIVLNFINRHWECAADYFSRNLKQALFAVLRIFLLWMVPLFAIASGIETFLTPLLLNALV